MCITYFGWKRLIYSQLKPFLTVAKRNRPFSRNSNSTHHWQSRIALIGARHEVVDSDWYEGDSIAYGNRTDYGWSPDEVTRARPQGGAVINKHHVALTQSESLDHSSSDDPVVGQIHLSINAIDPKSSQGANKMSSGIFCIRCLIT